MINFQDVKQWWIGQYEVVSAQLNGTTVWKKPSDAFYLTNDDVEPITISIKKSNKNAPTVSLEVSDDGETWTTLGDTSTTALDITIPVGGRKYLRSISANAWGIGTRDYTYFNRFSTTGNFGAHGNIMKLLGYDALKGFDCYSMFSGCTKLTTAPSISAITMAQYCCYRMFYGCTGLTSAPAIQATTVASNCCRDMFRGCTGIVTGPTILPAMTMEELCYQAMFYGCTSLTNAPSLPATTLAQSCYSGMFNDCSSLSSITCNATDISASRCTNNWVNGVAASGTFYKNPDNTSWTTGGNGIPSGWTVQDIA